MILEMIIDDHPGKKKSGEGFFLFFGKNGLNYFQYQVEE